MDDTSQITQSDDRPPATAPAVSDSDLGSLPKLGAVGAERGSLEQKAAHPPEREHIRFAESHEQYVRHYIQLADTKASFSFAIAVGLLVFLFNRGDLKILAENPNFDFATVELIISSLLLSMSGVCSFLVIYPRMSASGQGVFFYRDVAAFPSADAYVDCVSEKNEVQLAVERLSHNYDISRVCLRKYDMLRRAILLGGLGIFSTCMWLLVG